MPPKTTVARLRIEIITKTRIVRRVIDVSTKTGLPTLARVIRAARGWWKEKHYRFNFGPEKYSNRSKRGADIRQANGKALSEALGDHTSFEFVHDITAGRSQTIQVESISKRDEPETAFPAMVEAAGTLAIEDLTPDDTAHQWVADATGQEACNRNRAIEMLLNEGKRAELEQFWIESGIDGIRLGRRGPLRSHQEGSARKPGPSGLPPEPETETERFPSTGKHKALVLRINDDDAERPTATVKHGSAYFNEQQASAPTRQRACEWVYHETTPNNAVTETGKLARMAPADLRVVQVYGHTLEKAHRQRDAIDVYRHVFNLGIAALPAKFNGRIDKNSDTARALLDAAGRLGRCECNNGAKRRGIGILERLAQWDDEPRNEAWLHLGSLYVAQGDPSSARRFVEIERRRSFHPPYDYDLALCEILDRRWDEAMGATMRGLAGNPYIAELLLKCTKQRKILLGCHEGSRSISCAEHYVLHYQYQWTRIPRALQFLRWVQNHPTTLAAMAPLREYDHRAALTDDQDEITRLTKRFIDELDQMRLSARAAIHTHAAQGKPKPWTLIGGETTPWWAQ